MIRRSDGDSFLLITQAAHAQLAGWLAAYVGNERFTPPFPRAAVLKAIEFHDAGWPTYDEAATINPAGEPTDVLEMPMETVLPIWSLSTRRAVPIHPYAGLLVSLHSFALSLRVKIEAPPPGGRQDPRSRNFSLIKFQHQEIEIQEHLRRQLGMRVDMALQNGLAPAGRSEAEDQLLFNFHLLEFADQLSLNLCFDDAKFPLVENFYATPGGRGISLLIRRTPAGLFTVAPWPFSDKRLEFEIGGKRVGAGPYADDGELRRAIATAPVEAVRVRLVPA